jgi:uncharacterized protein YggE
MKNLILLAISLMFCAVIWAQQAGNVTYGNQNYRLKDTKAPVQSRSSEYVTLEVAGIYNIKTDGYIAIFGITQMGKTADEADQLMKEQIEAVRQGIKSEGLSAEVFVDMISFVPMYEYEVEKKVFSKKTYKEIPTGFEMKKNLHIKYTDPEVLERLISICAKAEIYDIVKVDYFSDKLEQYKDEMRAKSVEILKKKMKFHNDLLGIDLDKKMRNMGEGFQMIYPLEQYASFQAYSSSALNAKKGAKVTQANKTTSMYYNPVFPKAHDFVINAGMVEPTIQLLYTVQLTYHLRKDKEEKDKPVAATPPPATPKKEKEIILITAQGQIQRLNID